MQCKTCGSDNTQRLEVAYQHGTSTISTTSSSVGIGVGGSGLGIGSASTTTKGVSTSLLAARAAPPAKKRYRYAFIIPVIIWVIAAYYDKSIIGNILNIAGYAALAIFLFFTYQFNSNTWPQLYQRWQSMWVCHKCGVIYSQD